MEPNWMDIAFTVKLADAERAQLLLGESTEYGIYIEDYSRLEQETLEIAHIDLIDKELLKKDRECVVIHLYIGENENVHEYTALLEEKLKNAGIHYQMASKALKTEDWANNWKQYFHQLEIGKQLLICPSWEQAQAAQGRRVLYLEPGMAFGTGTHATTCLCMEVMEPYITPGCEVLDVGCGSGILALSAVLLGAARAQGVDIDEKAVKTARENAARNGMREPQVQFIQGNLTEQVSGTFDVILANIVADVIVLLCEDIAGYMREQTVLITSGIIRESEAQVKAAFEKASLEIIGRAEKAGWLSFVLKKKDA